MTLYERLTPAAKKALSEHREDYPHTVARLEMTLRSHINWMEIRYGDMDTLFAITGASHPVDLFLQSHEVEAGK